MFFVKIMTYFELETQLKTIQMELITRIPTEIYESDDYEEFEISEAARVKERWNEETAEIELINIGAGADWIVVLQTIGSIADLLKVGIELAGKLIDYKKGAQKLLKCKKEDRLISVDIEGAKLLTLQKISEYENITSIEFTDQMVVPLVDMNNIFHKKRNGLARHPFNHYTFALKVNKDLFYITSVTYSGDVEITRCYECFSDIPIDKTEDIAI